MSTTKRLTRKSHNNPRKENCKKCGAEIIVKSNKHSLMCRKCYQQYYYRKKHGLSDEKTPREDNCKECGAPIVVKNAGHSLICLKCQQKHYFKRWYAENKNELNKKRKKHYRGYVYCKCGAKKFYHIWRGDKEYVCKKCSKKTEEITHDCEICGHPTYWKRHIKNSPFICRDCQHKQRQGGKIRKTYKRYEYTCSRCSRKFHRTNTKHNICWHCYAQQYKQGRR